MTRSLPVLLAGLLLLGAASAHGTPEDTAKVSAKAAAEVERFLGALHERPEARATVIKGLVGLGPAALPALFRALISLGPRNTEVRCAVALRVLRSARREDLRSALRVMAVGDVPLASRVRALRVLEVVGGIDDVDVFLEVASSVEARQMRSGGIRACVRRTARHLLARGTKFPRSLETAWPKLSPVVRTIILDALAELGWRRAITYLGRLLRSHSERVGTLDRLAMLPVVAGEETGLVPARGILAALGALEPETLRAACGAAGRYHLAEAFDRLAALLDEKSPVVRRASRRALRTITRVDMGERGEDWLAWRHREERWFREDMPDEISRLAYDEPETVREVLRGLERRRLLRDRIHAPVISLIAHELPDIRVSVCRTLGVLGGAASLASLVRALDDAHPDVRNAAQAALCAITGRSEQGDAKAWRHRLEIAPPAASSASEGKRPSPRPPGD
jgi:HEAT repeat protein